MSTSEEAQKKAAIEEFERLLGMASEQPVIEVLSTALDKFRSELLDLTRHPPSGVTYKIASRFKYKQWVDSPENAMITLLFDNLTEDDVDFDITPTSLEVKAINVEGDRPGTKENFRYSIPKLFKEVNKDESSLVVKREHILITLSKIVIESWPSLRKVEPRQKRARIEN